MRDPVHLSVMNENAAQCRCDCQGRGSNAERSVPSLLFQQLLHVRDAFFIQHRVLELRSGTEPELRLQRHGTHQGGIEESRYLRSEFRRPLQRVSFLSEHRFLSVHRFRGHFSGNAPVHGGPQRVDIRPGSLNTLGAVLFRRSIADLQDDRTHLLRFQIREPGGAEVKQLHPSVVTEHDIVGAYVSVQDARFMYNLQDVHDTGADLHSHIPGQPSSLLLQVLFQRAAGHILHDHITGAVGLKIIKYLDDVFILGEFRSISRLGKEALQSCLELSLLLSGVDQDLLLTGIPVYIHSREVFLYRDDHLHHLVPGAVDDSETTVCNDCSEIITVLKKDPGVKMIGFLRGRSLFEAAQRTEASFRFVRLIFLHATLAAYFHLSLSHSSRCPAPLSENTEKAALFPRFSVIYSDRGVIIHIVSPS